MNQNIMIPEDSIVSMCKKLLSLCGGHMAHTERYDVIAPKASFFYSRFVPHAPVSDELIDVILADAAENGGPGLLALTEELVGTDWNAALEAHGFIKRVTQTGMVIGLDGYAPQAPDEHVVRIDGDRLEEWSAVCEVSFPKPPEIQALRWWIGDPDCEFYAYLEDGRIVGTLLGYAEDGNYGIHEVSTLPDCRRRGVCRALVQRSLASAKAAGNRYASLQASPTGAVVYEACGFKPVSSVSCWILPQK